MDSTKSADFVGVDLDTRKVVKTDRLAVTPVESGGVRLVQVHVESDPLPQYGQTITLRAPSAVAAGHAMINAATGQPMDDAVEPWDPATPAPDAAWLARTREELFSDRVRATSEGHKRTIYAARLLFAALDAAIRARK